MDTNNSRLLSELIAKRKLDSETIGRVMKLYTSGKDVLSYLQKDYTNDQLNEILAGLEDGSDVSFYDNLRLSPAQMRAIRSGIAHLSCDPSPASIEEQTESSKTYNGKNENDSSTIECTTPAREQQTSEETQSDSVDEKAGSSSFAGIIGKILGFVVIAALLLLPRLCARRIEKENKALFNDLTERGLVVKDGNIKVEPKLTSVHSGCLSLEHTKGWESAKGDADGYGYNIDLSYDSDYVASIQVAAFKNPNNVSLSRAAILSKNEISSLFDGQKITIGEIHDYDINDTPAKVYYYSLPTDGANNISRRCITIILDKYVLLINEAIEDNDDDDEDFSYIFGAIERSIKIDPNY